jgi:hypothetical protein
MSDVELVRAVQRHVRLLCDFHCQVADAKRTNGGGQPGCSVQQRIARERNALLRRDLRRLDELATQHLNSHPGEWGDKFASELRAIQPSHYGEPALPQLRRREELIGTLLSLIQGDQLPADTAATPPSTAGPGGHADGMSLHTAQIQATAGDRGVDAAPQATAASGLDSGRSYTLGDLIRELDRCDHAADQARRAADRRASAGSPDAAWWYVQAVAFRWQPDGVRMPGIERIELICNRLYGTGITLEGIRRLRAKLCDDHHLQLPSVADQLDLNTVANTVENVRLVSPEALQRQAQGELHHGLMTYDDVGVGGGQRVQITGLSCKVIAGTTPTVCPDANPPVPPSVLPAIDQAIRRRINLPPGTTIHWVGHDTGYRSRCRCHPDAPYAAPFWKDRWGQVVAVTNKGEGNGSSLPSAADAGKPATVTAPRAGVEDAANSEPSSTERRDLALVQANTNGVAVDQTNEGQQAASPCEAGMGKAKSKRSTAKGEAQVKIVAALTEHHQYADGGCLNQEPIGVKELADLAAVAKSSASKFFTDRFEGYAKYRIVCRDPGRLADSIKALNGEFCPHDLYLYGRRPADEDDRDEVDE